MRLSPCDYAGRRSLVGIGIADFFNRRFRDAAAKLLVSLEEMPGWAMPYRFLAASYAHMGRLDDARDIITRLRAPHACRSAEHHAFPRPKQRELLLSGLRLAAGEEA